MWPSKIFFTHLPFSLPHPPTGFIHRKVCYLYSFLIHRRIVLLLMFGWFLFVCFFFNFFFLLSSVTLWPFAHFFILLQFLSFLGYVPSLISCLFFHYFSPSSLFYLKFGVWGDFSFYEFMQNKLHCKNHCSTVPALVEPGMPHGFFCYPSWGQKLFSTGFPLTFSPLKAKSCRLAENTSALWLCPWTEWQSSRVQYNRSWGGTSMGVWGS